jgi:hypothetical protein
MIARIEKMRDSRAVRMLDSVWFDRLCWAGIVLAVLYFGPVCFRILAR